MTIVLNMEIVRSNMKSITTPKPTFLQWFFRWWNSGSQEVTFST